MLDDVIVVYEALHEARRLGGATLKPLCDAAFLLNSPQKTLLFMEI